MFSPDAVLEIKSTFERLVSISKQESVKLAQMLDWLPVYPNLPEPGMNVEVGEKNPLQHFHQLFDAHAKTRPTALALDCQELGISMTYGELYNSSQQKAKGMFHLHSISSKFRVTNKSASSPNRKRCQPW